MPEHECETYDFPIKQGTLQYTVKKTVVKQAGGTGLIAVREAVDEARDQAERDGQAAMKKETCAKPCERLIYVEPTIDAIDAKYTNAKKGELTIVITGRWKTGILCVKHMPQSK